MKSYTDLEQSKKLAEILSLESADACWTNHLFGSILSSWRVESTPPQEYKSLLDRFVVRGYLIEPAWSLTALLNVLPSYELNNFGDGIQLGVKREALATEGDETLIDLVVNMIIYLHELNLL